MIPLKRTLIIVFLYFLMVSVYSNTTNLKYNFHKNEFLKDSINKPFSILVTKNIRVKTYFKFIDSIVNSHNSNNTYKLNEHIIVRYNPWIIDTLANTDYYRLIAKDSFVYNQKEMIVLKKGSKIKIPDSVSIAKILNTFNNTYLDLNIPEYKLRIYQDSIMLFEFPVRVGRNERKYLQMAKGVTDLRTRIGNGKIVAHNRYPDYYNPVNNHQYFVTVRDDDRITKLPQIPWIETEINGVRYGQLIHPTTNPKTLNKAYSNGCIGTKEADAWYIYYYAPIGTKITIRYNLEITNEKGEKVKLKDIYGYGKKFD